MKIEMYTKTICPYCIKAKALFKLKNVEKYVIEYNLDTNPNLREEMLAKANGGRTVPQIFINGKHIGGCDDMYALDAKNQLDELLKV
jgi:glutaredoxin 3